MKSTIATGAYTLSRRDRSTPLACICTMAFFVAISTAIFGYLSHQYQEIQILGPGNWSVIPAKVIKTSHSRNYGAQLIGRSGRDRYILSVEYMAAGRKCSETVDTNLSSEDLKQGLVTYAPNVRVDAYKNKIDSTRVTLNPGCAYFWSGASFWIVVAVEITFFIMVVTAIGSIAGAYKSAGAMRQRLKTRAEFTETKSPKHVKLN